MLLEWWLWGPGLPVVPVDLFRIMFTLGCFSHISLNAKTVVGLQVL